MIRRWLAERSEQELRNVLAVNVLRPGSWSGPCLVSATSPLGVRDGETLKRCAQVPWATLARERQRIEAGNAQMICAYVTRQFDALCTRFGNVRITRLIHEACLRELTRRGPAPSIPATVPAREEATV